MSTFARNALTVLFVLVFLVTVPIAAGTVAVLTGATAVFVPTALGSFIVGHFALSALDR